MTRAVMLDFGGVLVEWDPTGILATFYEDPALRDAARAAIFRHPDWSELDRGTLDEGEGIARFASRLGRPVAEIEALMRHMRESLRPIPGTIALLRDLVARDVPVYGLSNMSTTTFAFLRARDDFWGLFRDIVISAEEKTIKPEAAIFERAIERFGVVPEETVFTDDHTPNVDSARARGFRAFRFDSPGQCRARIEAHLRPR